MTGDEDLARATYAFRSQGLEPMKIWRWVTASGISTKERDDLRVRDDISSADPTRLVGILLTIGQLLRRIKQKNLVIVFDELDRTKVVGPEAGQTFSTAFTRITEPSQTDAAIFFSFTASRIQDLPILSDSVISRIGKMNSKEIPQMSQDDVLPFVTGVVGYIRAEGDSVKDRIERYKEETDEHVTEDLYPFTMEAIEAIKTVSAQKIVPREICQLLSLSAASAKIRGKHVVGSKDVSSASGPRE
jgi:hypothetical protein